ncbi:hypothetical protein [Micromonospora maris]|uniref:Uncharacterized protein n=1 Tax=Micromonospora maris TaxID=1003110 RepID=A0A9X0I4S0_9ACTN|nr:hypothetical protein [Micromonospora maris]AEB47842.1 hypothetical protein VAB18032_03800 [Micromonospora maris AB-18-032]KUJ46851.1 hypothetical protein ADL17_28780 [Micromonospora maris]
MAISSCDQCGKGFRSVSIDDTGTLAICTAGHYNFDPTTTSTSTSTSTSSVQTGAVQVNGQSAIGNGAIVIGRRKRR